MDRFRADPIAQDITLGYKLLRLINPVFYGLLESDTMAARVH